MPTKSELTGQAIESFWTTVPPLWHQVRAFIREKAVEEFDITVGQFHILRRIKSGKDSVSKLADDKHISRGAISRAVDMLVNKGLIHRTQNPEDRRYIRLSLTLDGQVLLETLFGNTRAWMEVKMAALDEAELETIDQAMQALKRAFE